MKFGEGILNYQITTILLRNTSLYKDKLIRKVLIAQVSVRTQKQRQLNLNQKLLTIKNQKENKN